jgi:alpha-galactosidase
MLAAPLIAGNDLRKMSRETESILTNKEVIAVNQDKLGIEGFKYIDKDSLEEWVKPLANDNWAVCFLNRSQAPVQVNFNWKEEIINDTLFKKTLNANTQTYKIRNLWSHSMQGDTQKPFVAMLPSHDVIVVRLSK